MLVIALFVINLVNWGCSSESLQCHVSERHACRNVFTAVECGQYEKCLEVWKRSKWGSVKVDGSSQCALCNNLARTNPGIPAMSRLCEVPFKSSQQNSKCHEFLKLWNFGALGNVNEYVFCNIIGWCDSHKYIGSLNFGSPICEDCKRVIEDIRKLIADNATATAISDKLNQLICDPLPRQFRAYCSDTVNVHVPVVLHMIEIQIVPHDVCALLSLCPQAEPFNVAIGDLLPPNFVAAPKASHPDSATHTRCQDKHKFSWISRPGSIGHAFWTSLSHVFSVPAGKPSQQECVAVLEQIRLSLNGPKMKEVIKKDIDEKICSILPSFLRSACATAVNVHFDDIMESLNQAKLADVCAMFGMRDVSTTGPLLISGLKQTLLKPGVPLPGVCQVCELLIHELMNMVLKNSTKESITEALERVCTLVPHGYQHQCESLVVEYGARIIEAIIEGTAPKIICYSLGLCGPISGLEPLVTSAALPVTFSYCDTCKLFVSVVQQQLINNQTRAEIELMVDRMCKVLPGSYADECVNLVQQYLPVVLDYIAKDMAPEAVCQEINLCPSSGSAVASVLRADRIASQLCSAGDMHPICQSNEVAAKCNKSIECMALRFRQFLSSTAQQGHTKPASDCHVCNQLLTLWRLLKKLNIYSVVRTSWCSSFTNLADSQQCQLIVSRRNEITPPLFGSGITEEDLCMKLDLCRPSAASSVDVPGAAVEGVPSACRDPSYWCSSERSAKMCDRERFCDFFFKMRNRHQPSKDIFGVDLCEWGAHYYCQSEERAKKCDKVDECRDKVWTKKSTSTVSPCALEPPQLCASEETIQSCGPQAIERCQLWSLLGAIPAL